MDFRPSTTSSSLDLSRSLAIIPIHFRSVAIDAALRQRELLSLEVGRVDFNLDVINIKNKENQKRKMEDRIYDAENSRGAEESL